MGTSQSVKHHQQLTQLYLALSQCTQAIVQSHDRQALFEKICRIIVDFGHAKLAWVGQVEPESRQVKVTAAVGTGLEYLSQVSISADPTKPNGRGPCGTAIATDQPFWLQDFQTNPVATLWHASASEFSWKAAAFLPLHSEGKVVACLSLYASEEHAFDPDTQRLLIDMVANIDFALDRFVVQQERTQYQQSLLASEQRARLVMENALDAIINMDTAGNIIEWNRAAERIFGHQRSEVVGKSLGEVIVPPAYREAHDQGLKRLQQTGESKLLGRAIEISAIRRDA